MNEETVKNKIIVPYFEQLGFSVDEIEYETSFPIKLGRQTHLIDGGRERASGRLDILYKKGDQNLFVVETKSQQEALTDEDKEQAISYARLLKQIAPYAVVTNDICTKIYDVITRNEILEGTILNSTYVRNGYTISLSSELRYQALKSFISLNFDNLKIFCKKQLESNTRNLIADRENPERKVILETYLRRRGINEAFEDFLKKESKVFSIIGESGFGKTNVIIDLAIEYSNSNPILFFNGAMIRNGIIDEIASDFNWEFEGDRTGISIIKKMADIFSQHNIVLIIFIDAIDEAPLENFEIDLDNFVKHLSDMNAKICVTCKESMWHRFISISSNPSHIKNCLFLKDGKDVPYSFRIEPFSNDELDEAIQKYRDLFNLPEIEGFTRELCRNPLMLRVLSETYGQHEKIPHDMIDLTVVKNYIDKKMEKSKNRERDSSFLSIFGRTLFDSNKELIYEDEIIRDGLSIPEYMISFSILKRTQDNFGRFLIGFQYDYIRDFVISLYSLKMDRISSSELRVLVSKKIHDDLARSVFRYFERFAEKNIRNILRDEFSRYNYRRAIDFVKHYQDILDAEFTAIRNRFYPYTKGEIGLLVFYHLNPYFISIYGFRKVTEGEERVTWLERENWFEETTEEERWKLAIEKGVKTLFTHLNFADINPQEYARDRATEQLRKLIESRMLDESQNIVLSIEYVLDMMSEYNTRLGLPEFDENFWKKALPISVEELIKQTERFLRNLQTTLEATLGHSVPPPLDLVRLLSCLYRIRDRQSIIEKMLLPFPSKYRIPRLGAWLESEYTLDELIDYLNTFFRLVLQEYKILVDHNLPNLRQSMETYKILPTRVIGEIKKNDVSEITYCFTQGKDDITVEIVIKGKESIFDPKTFIVHTSTGDVKIKSYHSSIMYLFFESDSSRDNIIQKHVYELIFDDLRKVFNW